MWRKKGEIGWLLACLRRRCGGELTEGSSYLVGHTGHIEQPLHASAICAGVSGEGAADGGGVSVGENGSVGDAGGVVGDDFGVRDWASVLSERNGEEAEGGGND